MCTCPCSLPATAVACGHGAVGPGFHTCGAFAHTRHEYCARTLPSTHRQAHVTTAPDCLGAFARTVGCLRWTCVSFPPVHFGSFFDGFIYIQHERNRSSVLESNAAPEHACSSGTLSGSGAARGYWNAPTVLGPPRWCWNAPMVLGPPRGPGTPGGAGTLVVLGRGIPVPPGGSSTIGVLEPRFGPWTGGGRFQMMEVNAVCSHYRGFINSQYFHFSTL